MAQPLGPLSISIDQKPNFDSLNHYLIVHADTPSAIDDYQYMVPLSKVYNRVVVTLTSAQILTSNATPITLIPAPGAGKYILLTSFIRQTASGTTDYITNTSAVVEYAGGTDIVSINLGSLGAVGAANTANLTTSSTVSENTAIQFFTAVGNPATGNKSIKMIIEYRIIDFSETV